MKHDSILGAVLIGVRDRLDAAPEVRPLRPTERLDGKTALVTGSNVGLGHAAAIGLAQRGARVIMACRSGIPEAGEAVSRYGEASMQRVDLSDLGSVKRLVDALEGERLDVVVLNAGVVPKEARRTPQGLELMFAVNFLANVALVRRLIERGILPKGEGARIIAVSSDSHRSARPIELETLGRYVPYGIRGSMAEYSYTKLLLSTWAMALGRRHEGEIAVHHLCPGAVHTRIAREAPAMLAPVLDRVMKRFFRSPEEGARPILWLACAEGVESGRYLHVLTEKEPAPAVGDEALGARLLEASEALAEALTPSDAGGAA